MRKVKISNKNKFSEEELDNIISDVVGDSIEDFQISKSRLLVLRVIEPISTKRKPRESLQTKN